MYFSDTSPNLLVLLFGSFSGLADVVAEEKDGNNDKDGYGDIEEIATGDFVLTQSHQMDAIIGVQQDRP